MTTADRFRLRFGPYRTPRFKYGDVVLDEARDCEVVIVGISNGRIPWPLGRLRDRNEGQPGVVVYGKLADAIRRSFDRVAVELANMLLACDVTQQ